ncbi:3872_t:CDS:1 [Funneliformis mosseae]|uniref:3872_t:CDS:1 n=1 Tax=Funneliformis mosseae TaxID=27381 RepID=A0A9N9FWS0_FUNMO|nr:3872_t:CDS:1 [Funneliformis mosseae]
MNRKFIFAFLFLVALSMINAIPHKLFKRISPFICPQSEGSTKPPNFQVSFSPNPPSTGEKVNVTISGKFSEDVTEKTTISIGLLDRQGEQLKEDAFEFPACGTGCTKAGDPYSRTVEVQIPKGDHYIVFIGVSNTNTDVLGCEMTAIL